VSRHRRHPAIALAAGACLLVAGMAVAHDPPRRRIAALTERLEREPGRAPLHVARADLYLAEEQWHDALADYDAALALGVAEAHDVHRRRAEALLGARIPGHALVAADLALAASNDGAAQLARARALHALGRFEEASRAYERAWPRLGQPRPDHLLEHARALTAVGTAASTGRAIAVLDAGGARLGRPVALDLEALALEVELGRWEAALSRVDRLEAQARRTEPWLLRRAAIEALPAHHRRTPATGRLEAEARQRLAYLAAFEDGAGSDSRERLGRVD
jgi:tetratricopeptide (TPR) repeat protein